MTQRLVVLSGTLAFNRLIGDVENYTDYVRQAFTAAGWNIAALRLVKGTLFSSSCNITIEAYVESSYTAEQARANATSLLGELATPLGWQDVVVPIGAYFGSGKLFSNIALYVLSDNAPQTINRDTTGTTAVDKILNSIGNAAIDIPKNAISNITSNPATPIAIAAGVILLVVILKK